MWKDAVNYGKNSSETQETKVRKTKKKELKSKGVINTTKI